MRYTKIVVPLDGSDLAEAVLPFARDLAVHLDASITLIEAITVPVLSGNLPEAPLSPVATERLVAVEMQTARDYLDSVATRLRAQGVAVHADVVFAPPATAIIDTADESSIVAMTTHGRTGLARFVLGSVASLVVRSLAAPVLVVRPFTVPSGDLDRILVPLDGSAAAESVVPVVAALAPAFGARVHLLMVRSDGEGLDGDYLQGVAARLHDAGVQDVSEEVVAGHPAETITKVAGERRMKLIALATHGWGGLRRRAFGSVTDQILHGAMLPVLLVRARAAGA